MDGILFGSQVDAYGDWLVVSGRDLIRIYSTAGDELRVEKSFKMDRDLLSDFRFDISLK